MSRVKQYNFSTFKQAVQAQFVSMIDGDLFTTGLSKDDRWDKYIDAYPEGSNPIYKTRTEHDCQCCKQFIRKMGNVVAMNDGELVSIWDINIGGHYQVVADAMSKAVKAKPITGIFYHYENSVGTDFNRALDGGSTVRWDHFYLKLPNKFVKPKDKIAKMRGSSKSNFDVFHRAMNEITLASVDVVLELIEQGSLYRGDEHKGTVKLFQLHKKAFDKLKTAQQQVEFSWKTSALLGGASRLRNTSIGTLLVDISDGEELDKAVASFESKVAPENYQRPTALVTKSMLDKAEEKLTELGVLDSLSRRYAVQDDITINNVLFANRAVKESLSVFDDLKKEVKVIPKNFDKIEEVTAAVFMTSILPKADKLELLFENKHTNNLMSLLAPVHTDSKPILKWDNNFSWTYNGEVADSIKERVKKAGGSIEGYLRFSLSWFNTDDLDIHIRGPYGEHIYYFRKIGHESGGRLDVDMNAGSNRVRNAVENVIFPTKGGMTEGDYRVYINQFHKRENVDVGFEVEMEVDDKTTLFTYDKAVTRDITVLNFNYSRSKGITISDTLPSTSATQSKEVWGIGTNLFQNVSMVMNSPNHWDGHRTGNKHLFFILEGCNSGEKGRGFYNEFLNPELKEHRKVFELLGSRMKAKESDQQLSGLGFSSTKRNSVVCKVSGSFNRVIKINF